MVERHEGCADTMNDLSTMSLRGLLGLHSGIMEELRRRGVARNENNPTANLSEFLFCRAYDWQRAPNSEKGFSARDRDGRRYQIKGRRLHPRNESRQLSAKPRPAHAPERERSHDSNSESASTGADDFGSFKAGYSDSLLVWMSHTSWRVLRTASE